MNYFKILRKLQQGDKSSFEVPIEEQSTFLNSLGKPKNDIDRGYKQYLCQNFFVCPKWKIVVFNVIGAIVVPLIVLYYLAKGLFVKQGEQVGTMIERKGMDEVVPDEVKERYNPDNRYWDKGSSMRLDDLPFLLRLIVRAPHHPYFVLKAWMNVVLYSDMIRRHHPQAMIQFGEFSFSSSILTAYCHRYGVSHIDIMHGEKLYFIRDAFFHYDECYVWSEHYARLFKELKAESTQFRIAVPKSIKITDCNIKYRDKDREAYYADYKYYLAIYTEEQIKSIVESMSFAKRESKTVRFRPHPRYSDMALLRKYVKEDEIELPNTVTIIDSILNLDYAVGSYTTVLTQAFFSGKNVLLDDVTFKEQQDKLKEMKYILAAEGCETLSSKQ